MRTTVMSDGVHGALIDKLHRERKQAHDAIVLIERNQAAGWKGVPTANRRDQEERLPSLRNRVAEHTEWLDALNDAPVH